MTNYAGTNVQPLARHKTDTEYEIEGSFTVPGGGLASTDTITWTNILPEFPFSIRGASIYSTAATTVSLGNTDNATGLVNAKAVGANASVSADGALLSAVITNRGLVATLGATLAAGAVVRTRVRYFCGQTL